jgi:HlyD family secretion protein
LIFVSAALGLLAGCGAGQNATAIDATLPGGLCVWRGSLAPRLALTGEVEAVNAAVIRVPRIPDYRAQVKRIAEDGSRVRRGEVVVELDNAAFARNLEDRRLAVIRAEWELERVSSEVEASLIRAEASLETSRTRLAKAELDLSVPKHLLSEREVQARELACDQARAELAKAVKALEVARRAGQAEVTIKRVELERARGELTSAEAAIDALQIEAPRDGLFIVDEMRGEGRKIQVSDTLFVGSRIASIPELDQMQVRVRLPDVDDGLLAPGMVAGCTPDCYPELALSGHIEEISSIAREPDRRSRRRFFEVTISLDSTDPDRIRPGMSLRVEIPLPEIPDALLVPRAALDLETGRPRVRLFGGEWRVVELGPCAAMACVVRDGLTEGTVLEVPEASG